MITALLITLSPIAVPQALAQQAPAASTAASGDTVRLSPFEVTTERDGSFQSNSVGTGSRLTLNLKDTPVAYTVINREFIDALGINNLGEAATWATGQTFYSTDNGGTAFGRPSQYFSRGNLTDQSGSDSFGAQRNFYQNANVSGDSYAVESYDFGRGPNAALFGTGAGRSGGLSGVSSIQSKRARFDSSTTTVTAELGQWGYRRATVDYNRPINDRLGVRINAVDSSQRGWRNWDMKSTRGVTITSTWNATNSTVITLEGSNESSAFHTVGTGMDEYISGWDGQTVFRGPVTNSMLPNNGTAGPTSVVNGSYGTIQVLGSSGLTYGGAPNGVNRSGANTYRYDAATGTVMNYQNFPVTRQADDTSRTPVWTRSAPNGSYFVRGTNQSPLGSRFGTDVPFGIGRGYYELTNLPADIFYKATENSSFRMPSERFSYSLNHPSTTQVSRDLQLTISQRVGTNLYLELGGDINRNYNQVKNWDNPTGAGGGGRSVTIDIDMLQPDGSPNPHFLDTYGALPMTNSKQWTADEALRLNAAYIVDAGKWGNYTFNLNGNASQRLFRQYDYNLSLRINADPRRWPNDQLRIFSYGSDPVRGYSEPINGKTVQFTNVDWSSSNNPVVQAPTTVAPSWVLNNWRDNFFQSEYGLIQTTAKWFNDNLVLTGAYRRDVSVGSSHSRVNVGDLPANWDGATPVWRPDAPADYFQMTFIQIDTSTNLPVTGKEILSGNRPRINNSIGLSMPDPRYVGRFRDDYNTPKTRVMGSTESLGVVWHTTDWIAPFVNYSNSFIPPSGVSLDLNGQQRDPVSAYGYDYGAQFNLLGGKLNVKYDYYINVRENDSNNPPTSNPINSLYQSNYWTDTDDTSSGRNARGVADLPGNDYQKRRNFGYEIEVSANLLPGLRTTINGSSGSFSVTDASPLAKEYVPANADLFKQLLEDAGGSLDTTQKPADAPHAPGLAIPTPIAGNGIGIDTTQAVDAYNNIWVAYETILQGRHIRTPNQPNVNFFTDYTLQSGKLRGLRIGGGFQWQGDTVAGNLQNDTILDPNNPIPTAIDDPTKDQYTYLFLPGSALTQANLAYTFRLASGNSLSLGLRINNLLNYKKIVVGDAGLGGGTGFSNGSRERQPNGDLSLPNRVLTPMLPSRFPERINARLTATYTFGNGNR